MYELCGKEYDEEGEERRRRVCYVDPLSAVDFAGTKFQSDMRKDGSEGTQLWSFCLILRVWMCDVRCDLTGGERARDFFFEIATLTPRSPPQFNPV